MNYLQNFGKALRYQMFTKFVQLEPSFSLLTDGRTDGRTYSHDEPNIHFFEICDVPNIVRSVIHL